MISRLLAALAVVALAALLVLVPIPTARAAQITAVIDFDSGLSAGDTPSVLSVGKGISGPDLGTVAVSGTNPRIPGNTAMIFDSSCGGQSVPVGDPSWDRTRCSGEDWDLYIPGQGNSLIITEDGDPTDPDDDGGDGGFFTFDFSDWGPGVVTFESIKVIDLEDDEDTAEVRFFDRDGNPIGTIPIVPTGGDNTTATTTGDIAGVGSVVFFLDDSGAIDDFVVSVEIPIIDLELDKTVDNPTVLVGEKVTFTIEVTNQGPDYATGVEVTDTLPAGMSYVAHSTASGTFDSGSMVWTIGDLAVGEAASLELTVSVDAAGTFVNEAEVTAADQDDSDSTPGDGEGDDWDDETVTTGGSSGIVDLELTKTASPTSLTIGQSTVFTVTLTNQGPDDASGVEVTDVLPDGLSYVAHNASVGTFDALTLSWDVGDVAVGDVHTLELTARGDEVGTFVNEAEVTDANEDDSDSTPGDGEGDDWDDESVTVEQPPTDAIIDLELVKTVDDDTVAVGDEVTFTISVTNQGPDDASGVEVTDTLPDGLTYVSHDTATGSFDAAGLVWTIGDLAVGEVVTLDLVATADEVGAFVNEAEVTDANEDDSDSTPGDGEGDDWDDESVTVEQPPDAIIDLELVKTVDDRRVAVGDEVTFTITVTNQGPDDATGVEVTDTLPAELSYVSYATATGSFDEAGLVWTIGDLAVGDTVTLDLVVATTQIGRFVNEAEVTDANEDDSDSIPGDGEGDDWDDERVRVTAVEASGLIGDFVWFDDDKDGIQDAGEDGVPGVTIRLTNTDTNEISTDVTDADGLYLFSALDTGNYLVEIVMSTAPEMTGLTTVGSYTVPLAENEQFLTADFGLADSLPATGIEVEQLAIIGAALLGAGLLILRMTGRRRRVADL